MSSPSIASQVAEFCANIGADPLMVQGAGGNISWKEGDVLWVKASGTWLAEAKAKNIFVPVDLAHLKSAFKQEDFSIKPQVINDSSLRPSIETLLHALMPHQFVIHLHLVHALSVLVSQHWETKLKGLLSDHTFALVPYCKPGQDLAQAVNDRLLQQPNCNLVFLQSHGVVLGVESLEQAAIMLDKLASILAEAHAPKLISNDGQSERENLSGYLLLDDIKVQQLALNPHYFNALELYWALYPDHVVFLGRTPCLYASRQAFEDSPERHENKIELIFIAGDGVYADFNFSAAKKAQLVCYAEVMLRQKTLSELKVLSQNQIDELMNWDAEKYRQTIKM